MCLFWTVCITDALGHQMYIHVTEEMKSYIVETHDYEYCL
jgi:hypothetical protein